MIDTGSVKLMFGDCMKRLPELADNSVDLILTDPPYGTVADIQNHSMTGKVDWDVKLDTNEMFRECYRILRPNGTLALFSQDPYTIDLITNAHGNMPYSYRYTWVKNHFGNPLIAKIAPVKYTEDLCVFFKNDTDHRSNPLQKVFNDEMRRLGLSANHIGKTLSDGGIIHSFTTGKIFRIPSKEKFKLLQTTFGGFEWDYDELKRIDSEFKTNRKVMYPKIFNTNGVKSNILTYDKDVDRYHPTQKPIDLLKDVIETYTRVGDTVLDFTMGSGSTGVATSIVGRKFIGIEASPEYYGIACDRILTASPKSDTVTTTNHEAHTCIPLTTKF